jgi:hypothetical protein
VTRLPSGKYIIHSFENLESEQFTRVADLNYQEPLLPNPEPEANTEIESVTQGDQ